MRRIAYLAARLPRAGAACLLLALALPTAAANAEAPRVVATIAPVHALVAGVMEGVGEPHLLLPGESSPHDFALRPSDARAIAGADLVVWVGETLETFLAGVLETSGAPALALIAAPGVDPRPYGQEDGHEHVVGDHGHEQAHNEHSHSEDAHEQAHDDHGHEGHDPHVWLDPERAQAMVTAIADRLSEIDAENAETYEANARRLTERLTELDAALEAQLAPVRGKPFVTFHEGFGYFVARYGLDEALGVTLDPQRRPGARTMAALRRRAAEQGIVCAFAEPQFDERTVSRLAEEAGMRLGRLDPLGAGYAPGPELYFAMMRDNAASVADCLARGRVTDEPRH